MNVAFAILSTIISKGELVMSKEDQVETMMNRLSNVYNEVDEQKNPGLQEIIFAAAKDLEKFQDVGPVASKLGKAIFHYYLTLPDKKDFPKAAVELSDEVRNAEVKHDAIVNTE